MAKVKVEKTPRMIAEEARLGGPLEKVIPAAYQKTGNHKKAAEELGLVFGTYELWCRRLGLGLAKKVTLVQR
jgi:hypothetical protein